MLGITGAIVVVAAVLTPGTDAIGFFGTELPSVCFVGRLTDLGCPGCGMTRSVTFAMHGDLRQAFASHRLGILTTALFVASAVYLAVVLVADRRGRISWRKERYVLQAVLAVAAGALMINWLLKLAGV